VIDALGDAERILAVGIGGGGDALAHGDQAGLCGPLADAVCLAATPAYETAIIIPVPPPAE